MTGCNRALRKRAASTVAGSSRAQQIHSRCDDLFSALDASAGSMVSRRIVDCADARALPCLCMDGLGDSRGTVVPLTFPSTARFHFITKGIAGDATGTGGAAVAAVDVRAGSAFAAFCCHARPKARNCVLLRNDGSAAAIGAELLASELRPPFAAPTATAFLERSRIDGPDLSEKLASDDPHEMRVERGAEISDCGVETSDDTWTGSGGGGDDGVRYDLRMELEDSASSSDHLRLMRETEPSTKPRSPF
jgi:hypothetical protein